MHCLFLKIAENHKETECFLDDNHKTLLQINYIIRFIGILVTNKRYRSRR